MRQTVILLAQNLRLRFAPSPTGSLHLGGLRTALFNHLLKLQSPSSKLILRIEDTDQSRLVPGSVDSLVKSLEWAGIKFDETYIQSKRLEIYKKHIQKLLDTNNAYKCFCTPERLEELRGKATKLKRPFKYDQKCRQLKDQEINQLLAQKIPFTIRLKIHMENSNSVIVSDLVRGESKFNTKNLQDIILMKSDEYPTYHFANVIDDHLMGITHVLRGEEWSSSTPIHLLIYKAFCWTPPLYAHLPLLVHPNGSKLSKRSDGDLGNVQSYIDDGYLPEALVNFIAFLGWSPKSFDNLDDSKKRNESEIFPDIYSLSKAFSIQGINSSPSCVDIKRLVSINKVHLLNILNSDTKKRLDLIGNLHETLKKEIKPSTDALKSKLNDLEYFEELVMACKDRVRLSNDFIHFTRPFFIRPNVELVYELLGIKSCAEFDGFIELLISSFEAIEWNLNQIDATIASFQNHKHPIGSASKILRLILLGDKVGCPINSSVLLLGKRETLERLELIK